MSDRFPHLLAPLTLRGIELKNRIVMPAHGSAMASDGHITERYPAYLAARAKGGAGLIIMEAASVHETGVGAGRWVNIHDDTCIPGFRRVAEAVHAHGTPLFGQLYHPGRGDIAGSTNDGTLGVTWAPSALMCEKNQLLPRVLSPRLIAEVVRSYGDAAARIVSAGFDGIEIMGHHAHLIAQFLCPRVNSRTDAYGGSFDNRLRFAREVIEEVRGRIGERPLGLRLSGREDRSEGMAPDDTVAVAGAVDGLGMIDYFSINGGSCSTMDGGIQVVPPMVYAPGYTAEYAAAVRAVVSVPVLVTGRINTPQEGERILAAGQADLAGCARAMICDPEFARKTIEDRSDEIRVCIACNQACIGHVAKGASISCIQFPESGRETRFPLPHPPTARPLKVMVVGGGPGGMKAAAVAAARGHRVALCEQERRLGGLVHLAERLPDRAEFGGLATNLQREVEQAGVDVRLGTQVTRALVETEAPDAVILATGSRPHWPTLEDGGGIAVVHAWDVVTNKMAVGKRVVIADGKLDWVAPGLAERLAREGCTVRLCTLGLMPGANIPYGVRDHWSGVLHGLGVQTRTHLRLKGAADGAVFFEHAIALEPVILEDIDTLIVSWGGEPVTELEAALEDWPGTLLLAGDCLVPRTAEEAVFEGMKAALALP